MDSQRAAEGAAAAPGPNPKRLVLVAAAAGLALLAAVAAALGWWLQPGAASKKARRALAAPTPHVTAAASAASVVPAASAAAADAPSAAPATPVADAAPASSAAVAEPVAAMRATPAPRDEAPMDRLQRRLAEVLGPAVSVDVARPGELRVLTRSAVAPGASSAAAAAAAPAWGYSGMTGPRRWARLDPAFAACGAGREQSPIDIRGGIAARLEPLRFDYRAGGFGVLDAGHTVQVNAAPGNAIEFGGARYELQQLHFHRPSEERIDGRQFEMDVHLVHRDAQGRLAVVAVLLQRGAAQPLLHTVWQRLAPAADDDSAALAEIDPNQLLPQDRRYYSYVGSLTTPPCTEGVRWLVLRQPLTVSAQQIDAFAQRYPVNARPLQPAAGRVIRQSM